MDRNESREQAAEARLRAAFQRARVPASPPSLRARIDELVAQPPAHAGSWRRPLALLAAAAIAMVALTGTALLVGSRRPTPSPQPTPSANASFSAFVPPGPMQLFTGDQLTSGEGWRILGGAPGLAGPPFTKPTVELYQQAGLAKPIEALGLSSRKDIVDPDRDVIAVATIWVGRDTDNPGCGRIRLGAPRVDERAGVVTLSYTDARDLPGQSPLACRLVGIQARFAVALSIDHLPPSPFTLQLVASGRGSIADARGLIAPRSSSAPALATAVDEVGTFPKGGLWARDGRTLWTSTDTGRSWQPIALPVEPIALDIIDPGVLWLVSPTPDSDWPDAGQGPQFETLHFVVSRTDDGGAHWTTVTLSDNFAGQLPVVRFTDLRSGYLLLAGERFGQRTGMLTTSDAGATWVRVPTPVLPGFLGSRFSVGPDGALWAGSQGDAGPVPRPILDVSRDGGRTWTDARLPGLVGDVYASDQVLAPPAFFGDVGVVAVTTGYALTRVYTSADAGRHWVLACTLPADVTAFAASTRSDWFAADDKGLSLTDDGGARWVELGSRGFRGATRVNALEFADPNNGIAIVGIGDGAPAPTALFATRDRAGSWEPVALP